MNDLLPYLLKSTLSLSLLYLAFRIINRKESFFTLNRIVLLTVVVISFIIPLLYLPSSVKPIIHEQIIPQFQSYEVQAQPVIAIENTEIIAPALSPVIIQKENPLPYSAPQIIFFIYLAGVLISFLVFIHGIVSALLIMQKAKAIRKDGTLIFILNKDIPAFSFWKLIFISRTDYLEHGTTILAHEKQHVRLGHFYDLLLMEIVKMLHWFNPIVYWLTQDLKAIHEFQADRHTLTSGIDANKYQLLIIEKGVGTQKFALANSFNHCQIKKRITMMNKQMTSKAGIWKVATFLPLLALLLMAFGRSGENVQKDSPSVKEMLNQEKTIVTEPAIQSKDSIYSIVEVMPEFPGGEPALRKYIANNIKYPPTAAAKRIQGKVFVSYIITSEGKVTNPKVVRGVDPDLDAEALRVISIMPQWIPAKEKGKNVRMSYTIPINFLLPSGTTDSVKDFASLTSTPSTSIIGTWRLVSYNYGGGDELKAVPATIEKIKLITEKNFNWVHYAGKDKIVISSAGGSYTLSGEDYTEKIEFGAQDMTSYVGQEQHFKVRIIDGKLELKGELSDGLKIKELWERYTPSDKTSMITPPSTPQKKENNYIWIENDGTVKYNNEQISFDRMAEKVKSGLKEDSKLPLNIFIEEGKLEEHLDKTRNTLKGIESLNVNYFSFHQEKGNDSNGLMYTKVYSKPLMSNRK